MADLYPVSGCKIYIGPALAPTGVNFVAADFTALTYVEVKGWTMMGGYGDAVQMITEQIISENRDRKAKGTANAGSMQNQFVTDPLDPGQIAMLAASQPENKNNFAWKIELNDKPAVGASPKNSLRFFTGLVMGMPEQGGSANTVQKIAATIEINSNVVRVAAAAA
jgi:hypothetical protein